MAAKKPNFKILLTVPHAACEVVSAEKNPSSAHPCDAAAMAAANLLRNFLKRLSKRGADITIIAGDVPRSVVDMNRAASRRGAKLKQRSEIEKWVTETAGWSRAIVDVHSYDDFAAWAVSGVFDTSSSATDYRCFRHHPLIFLDIAPYSPFSVSVVEHVSSKSFPPISARIVEGTTENDILLTARKLYGVPCILAEFYEGSMRELSDTAKALAQALIYVLHI